jgi:hypothetical protein
MCITPAFSADSNANIQCKYSNLPRHRTLACDSLQVPELETMVTAVSQNDTLSGRAQPSSRARSRATAGTGAGEVASPEFKLAVQNALEVGNSHRPLAGEILDLFLASGYDLLCPRDVMRSLSSVSAIAAASVARGPPSLQVRDFCLFVFLSGCLFVCLFCFCLFFVVFFLFLLGYFFACLSRCMSPLRAAITSTLPERAQLSLPPPQPY